MKAWTSAVAAALVAAAVSIAAPAAAAPDDSGQPVAQAPLIEVPGAIGDRWQKLGGEDGVMGAPVEKQACDLRANACHQKFESGDLYWMPEIGRVHAVRGALRERWIATGAQDGSLGFPITDENCDKTGCQQAFERGQIHFTTGHGTFLVEHPVVEAYGRVGSSASPLGHPISEVDCTLGDDGCFQTFEKGSIYYSPSSQSWFVQGPIGEKWGEEDWEKGDLGYPMADPWCRLKDEGCFQTFENGSIYWTKDAGAFAVSGPIGEAWGSEGWEEGWLGFPTSDQGNADGGSWQTFQGGNLYHTEANGVMAVRGEILAAWGATGYENGDLGWPVTGEFCDLRDDGCATQFENGSIYYSPATGAQVVRGSIREAWAAKKWEESYLGYPTAGEDCTIAPDNNGCFQTFQFGSIYWKRGIGAFAVSGPILKAWGAEQYERGDLGFPMSDLHYENRDGNKVYFQEFEHGYIEYAEGHDPSVVMK